MTQKRRIEWQEQSIKCFAEIEMDYSLGDSAGPKTERPHFTSWVRGNSAGEKIFVGEGDKSLKEAYEEVKRRLPISKVASGIVLTFKIIDSSSRTGDYTDGWKFTKTHFDQWTDNKQEIIPHYFETKNSQYLKVAAAKMLETACDFSEGGDMMPEVLFPRSKSELLAYLLAEGLNLNNYPTMDFMDALYAKNHQGIHFALEIAEASFYEILVFDLDSKPPDIKFLVAEGIIEDTNCIIVVDQEQVKNWSELLLEAQYNRVIILPYQALEQMAVDKINNQISQVDLLKTEMYEMREIIGELGMA